MTFNVIRNLSAQSSTTHLPEEAANNHYVENHQFHGELRSILDQFRNPDLTNNERVDLYYALAKCIKNSPQRELEESYESSTSHIEHASIALEVAQVVEKGLFTANELDLTDLGEIAEGLEVLSTGTEGLIDVFSGISFGFSAYILKAIAGQIDEVNAAIVACDHQIQSLCESGGDQHMVELVQLRKQALEVQLEDLMSKRIKALERFTTGGTNLLGTAVSVGDSVLAHSEWIGEILSGVLDGVDVIDSISGGASVVTGGILAPYHFYRALSAGTKTDEAQKQLAELEEELSKTKSPVIASILQLKIDVLKRTVGNLVTDRVKRFVKSAAGTLKFIGGAAALSSLVIGPVGLVAGSVVGGAGLAIKSTEMATSTTQSVYQKRGELYHGARSVVPRVQEKLLNRQLKQAKEAFEASQEKHEKALVNLRDAQEIVQATEAAFDASLAQLSQRSDTTQQMFVQLAKDKAEQVSIALERVNVAVEQISVADEEMQKQMQQIREVSSELEPLQVNIQDIAEEKLLHEHHRKLNSLDMKTLKVMHRIVADSVKDSEQRAELQQYLAEKGIEPASGDLSKDDVYRFIFNGAE